MQIFGPVVSRSLGEENWIRGTIYQGYVQELSSRHFENCKTVPFAMAKIHCNLRPWWTCQILPRHAGKRNEPLFHDKKCTKILNLLSALHMFVFSWPQPYWELKMETFPEWNVARNHNIIKVEEKGKIRSSTCVVVDLSSSLSFFNVIGCVMTAVGILVSTFFVDAF